MPFPIDFRRLPAWTLPALFLLTTAGVWSLGDTWRQESAALNEQLDARRSALAWMENAAAEARALGAGAKERSTTSTKPLLLIVDEATRALQLQSALTRVQPDGDRSVRVSFEKAPFDKLLQWLDRMALENGLDIESLALDRKEDAVVDASLTLTRP